MSRPSNDEYIDYSCSTSVERLTRDVETLLRKWHVDQGSDRHVSVHSKNSNFHQSKSNSSIHSLSTSGSNSISSSKGKTTIDTIRSAVIEWNISFHHPTNGGRISSSDIALDLVLWDAPSEMTELTAGRNRNGTEEQEGSDEQAGLPFSLRRRQGVDLPFQGSVLDNFSTIFGIGQHITLSPKQPEALDPALVDFLSQSVISRHDSATIAGQVMTGVLTGFLQSALNTAACFCGCRFPLIGIWGHYQPSPNSSTNTFPSWLQSFDQSTAQQQRYNSSRRRHGHRNQQYMPPVITGSLRAEDCRATFWCNILAADKKWVESVQWSKWGNLLLSHCRHTTHEDSVHLWAARHIYSWFKPTEPRGFIQSFLKTAASDWRGDERHGLRNSAPEDVETYRQECRNVAIWLLEQAARASTTNPMWGPTENPVASLHASLTWNSPTVKNSTERLPLVSLPLKTRLPPEDRKEMEMAIASSIFEISNPTHFSFQCYFAPPEASLAATQRCVLAALVRASTLPRETLLLHVMDKNVIAGWDSEAGNHIAAALATRASLDDATHSLVEAMDWKNAIESIIDHVDAEERVLEALDGRLSLEFPSPPDQIATSRDDWKALLKSAPPGRLLSFLFVQMAHVRTPSSMALMWKSFVEELRQRWERQESLPNMQFVPGLDPPGDSYVAKRCFSTVGSKATFASQVHCSEPDPDDGNCLIGQKLQVFNICIETSLVEDMREIEKMENKRQKLDGPQNDPSGSGSPNGNLGGSIIDRLPDGRFSPRGGDDGTITSCTTGKSLATNRFFDADEGSVTFVGADGTPSVGGLLRKGARCPVSGASLLKTGDQLYAPYLQRPFPLTDDVITQRQLMMNRQKGAKASTTVKQRIEIAQRLQRPKLFSDMQAFKAANPGAVFQDFVSWYGNPDNPLENLDEQAIGNQGSATLASVDSKLDRAAEAIRVLEETRKFWAKTWEEAVPVSADEQKPLFDAGSTVEMTLDFLETLHPAHLICQVMAVNLAMAYFTLVVSSKDAVMVGRVRTSLVRLRERIVDALALLSSDASHGERSTLKHVEDEASNISVISIESLSACGRACLALSEAEAQVSRAKSLLYKLPQQFSLVDKVMGQPNGAPIEVPDAQTRKTVLNAIARQQLNLDAGEHSLVALEPQPSVREYILRNVDETEPCQLCVKYSDRDIQSAEEDAGNVLVALMTTTLDA